MCFPRLHSAQKFRAESSTSHRKIQEQPALRSRSLLSSRAFVFVLVRLYLCVSLRSAHKAIKNRRKSACCTCFGHGVEVLGLIYMFWFGFGCCFRPWREREISVWFFKCFMPDWISHLGRVEGERDEIWASGRWITFPEFIVGAISTELMCAFSDVRGYLSEIWGGIFFLEFEKW